MRHRAILILILLLVVTQEGQAGIGFLFEKSLNASDLKANITAVAFADVDREGMYEAVLASRGKLSVYSLTTSTVLRSYEIGRDSVLQLIFTDINRDKSPDIVYSFNSRTKQGPSKFTVVSIDGVSGRADTVRYGGYQSVSKGCGATGGTIGAYDLDKDGFQELLVVADTGSSGAMSESTFGQAHLYYSFPDSLVWNLPTPGVTSSAFLPHGMIFPGVWLSTQSCSKLTASNAKPERTEGYSYLLPDGKVVGLDFKKSVACEGRTPTFVSVLPRYATYGTSATYGSATEFITMIERRYGCDVGGDTIVSKSMEMYLIHQPTLIESWWSRPVTTEYEQFITSPEMPGYFFAFASGSGAMTMFRLSDGAPQSDLTEVPSGRKWWAVVSSDNVPRLVVTQGTSLSLYKLTVTGENAEDGRNALLPARFEFGQPIPSGRGLVVPLHIPRPGRVVIEIYNTKGERERLLADAIMQQGIMSVRVDANRLGSGIYSIRAQYGNQTESLQALLLK